MKESAFCTVPAGETVTLTVAETLDWLGGGRLSLGLSGDPVVPLVFMDLDTPVPRSWPGGLPALARAVRASHRVVVGRCARTCSAWSAPAW